MQVCRHQCGHRCCHDWHHHWQRHERFRRLRHVRCSDFFHLPHYLDGRLQTQRGQHLPSLLSSIPMLELLLTASQHHSRMGSSTTLNPAEAPAEDTSAMEARFLLMTLQASWTCPDLIIFSQERCEQMVLCTYVPTMRLCIALVSLPHLCLILFGNTGAWRWEDTFAGSRSTTVPMRVRRSACLCPNVQSVCV